VFTGPKLSGMSAARPPIANPQAVPVTGRDAHLPPLPADRLTAAALRARFAAPPPGWTPETRGDGGVLPGHERAEAAVLVPLIERADGLAVLLTQRTTHLRAHAGHVAFPGGRIDPEDASATAAALREAEEEVGLPRALVEVIGTLPVYRTVTFFDVTPVVALVRPGFTLALDSFEVAEAFEVPLAFLMTPANHRRHAFEAAGLKREFLSMPWPRADGPGEHFIWGATAAMIRNLYGFLAA
jgi:8-oxo-dGTP pyrophosphatase MutT (NUDIX family)